MPNNLIDTKGFNGLIKSKYGYVIFNKNDIYIGKGLQKYGEWSEGEVALFKQLCAPGSIVVEVGANIGVHTIVLSKLVGRTGKVIAFEPQHGAFQTLCGNMAINSLQNVKCFNVGVSSQSGELYIAEPVSNKANNFGGVALNRQRRGNKIPVIALDQFIKTSSLQLIKIDVEGMEQDVIQGAKELIQKHKPFLYVENDRRQKSKALIELIQSLDYRLYWHVPPLFNPKNHAGDSENIFDNLVSTNMICIHESNQIKVRDLKLITDSSARPF